MHDATLRARTHLDNELSSTTLDSCMKFMNIYKRKVTEHRKRCDEKNEK